MVFDSRRGKQVFARHPNIHNNYIGSGRVKYLQQFRIVANFATHRDVGLSLKQYTDGAANGCRIVSYEKSNRGSHWPSVYPMGTNSVYPTLDHQRGLEAIHSKRTEGRQPGRARQPAKCEPEESRTSYFYPHGGQNWERQNHMKKWSELRAKMSKPATGIPV